MTSDADQVEASTCQRASVCICLLRQREPGKRTIYFLWLQLPNLQMARICWTYFFWHQIKIPKKSIQRSPNLKNESNFLRAADTLLTSHPQSWELHPIPWPSPFEPRLVMMVLVQLHCHRPVGLMRCFLGQHEYTPWSWFQVKVKLFVFIS